MDKVKKLAEELDVSPSVAKELLILSGGDTDLIYWASENSRRLAECKARIINERLTKLEEDYYGD